MTRTWNLTGQRFELYGTALVLRHRLCGMVETVSLDLVILSPKLEGQEDFHPFCPIFFLLFTSRNTAFVALDDPTAFEHRHFSVRVINKLRLGTWPMEQRIADEVAHLVERFRSEQGAPFEPHSAIAFSASNVICALAFGRRFDETDERLKALIETQEVLLRTALSQTGAVQVLPWLRFLWPWRGAWRSYRASIARLHVAMGQLMDESECESRRVEHDDHHEVRSYVDAFAQRQRADSGNRKRGALSVSGAN